MIYFNLFETWKKVCEEYRGCQGCIYEKQCRKVVRILKELKTVVQETLNKKEG